MKGNALIFSALYPQILRKRPKKRAIREKLARYKSLALEGHIQLFEGEFDIDNDGKRDRILYIHRSPEAGGCQENIGACKYCSQMYTRPFLVLFDDDRGVDYRRSRSFGGLTYSPFFFDVRTYWSYWQVTAEPWEIPPDVFAKRKVNTPRYGVAIYEEDPKAGAQGVCKFLYIEE